MSLKVTLCHSAYLVGDFWGPSHKKCFKLYFHKKSIRMIMSYTHGIV